MSSNLGKTPKKAGGRFNTVATSTPTKSEPKVLKTAESSQSQAAHIQRTPVRGGALFHHASPGFHEDEEPVCQDNSSTIKVFVRVRPSVETDNTRGGDGVVSVPTTDTVLLHGSEPKPFTFDYAADPTTTQLEMFDMIGKPFTDSCLAGYNGSIFAYGQTGSGKTYTMQGPDLGGGNHAQRGLIPRSLEYLFDRIAQKQAVADSVKPGSLQFTVRCSYLEIYNETVTDLLDPSKVNLAVRENHKEGVYVDGITWQDVRTAEQTSLLLQRGVRNRHVAETSMNKESSRSHSLFTLKIESTLQAPEGLTKERHSCLNLVDLAGSERQKSTNATGDRLKEASNINRSLSALGNVIMALADISDGKARHVHYRDSKLTFLLKDSLGGNSKTAIIANVTASDVNFGETLSTLKFAQRAKLIKTRAILNEDTNGTVDQLRGEIKRLKDELFLARSSSTGLGGPSHLARIDSEVYASSTGCTPPRASGESGTIGAVEHVRQQQARVWELENVLYQCLEKQFELEEKVSVVNGVVQQQQSELKPLVEEECRLFQSFRMQLKLKAELVGFLHAKVQRLSAINNYHKCHGNGEAGSEAEDPRTTDEASELRELQQHLDLLQRENEELRSAQEIPLAWHPEYRRVATENAELVHMLQEHRGFDVESVKHVDAINRELREQFIGAVRDKAALQAELESLRAQLAADASAADANATTTQAGSSSSAKAENRRLSALTSAEREQHDAVSLQKWREQEQFEEQLFALKSQVDLLSLQNHALLAQAEASERRAKVAAGEVAELRPALKRMSAGETNGDEELSLRARLLSEARVSLEHEADGRRESSEALERAEGRVAALEEEVREGAEAMEAAHKREATLRHQLQAAEYATQALERRVNRVSASADIGRLGKLQEENESLQQRVDALQDEVDSQREEFAFIQTRLAKAQALSEAQDARLKALATQLEQAKGEVRRLEQRVEELQEAAAEGRGDEAQAELKLEAAMAEVRAELLEARRQLEQSSKSEQELRDGLAHQQDVHEALEQEASTMRAVLKEAYENLEGKGAALETLQAELNDKTSEAKDLGEQLQVALAAQDRSAQVLAETKRRLEALVDDREGLEGDHQRQMQEMMAELKKRQERIKTLEAEVSSKRDSLSEAQTRLSMLEGQAGESGRMGQEVKDLQKALQEKEVELFESNFDVQLLQGKVKKLEADKDLLEADREEARHGKEELQAHADKLQDQLALLQGVQERAERLGSEAEGLAGRVKALEAEREVLIEQVERMAQEVKDSGEQREEAKERAKSMAEGSEEGKDAWAKLAEQQKENADLKDRMKQWLVEMQKLKEHEDSARSQAAEHAAKAASLAKEAEAASSALAGAEKRVAELQEENAKLVGHQNAKQKVQHTVKIKEENNALKTQLHSATSELGKSKEKLGRLELEVTRLRHALGVEGGAAHVLEEEAKTKAQIAAREEEAARLRAELAAVVAAAETLATTPTLMAGFDANKAGEGGGKSGDGLGRQALAVLETVRGVMAENSKVLEAKEGELRSREFQNGLLKKELQLHKGHHAPDEENRHPNSPMTKSAGHAKHTQSPSLAPPKTPKTPLRPLQA